MPCRIFYRIHASDASLACVSIAPQPIIDPDLHPAINYQALTREPLTTLILIFALILDRLLGEPRRFHPLVGFAYCAQAIEKIICTNAIFSPTTRLHGLVAVVVLVLGLSVPIYVLELLTALSPSLNLIVSAIVVYFCIAPRSLSEHGMAVAEALQLGDIEGARSALAMIVSRDTGQLDEQEIAAAACESMLENGSDGIFAAIFWYLILGLYGVVIYRAINTLDAMWGYKNERYLQFGWAAARLDDVLNYIPARLVALSYALTGAFSSAIKSWQQVSGNWKSPNAGPVMAAGAGSLQISLGGSANYAGIPDQRPKLGGGRAADKKDIGRCLGLINRSLLLWIAVLTIVELWHG